MLKKLTRLLLKSILYIGLLLLFSEPSSAQVVEVVVEDPVLHPAYITCPESYWYPFVNNRGHAAYLTLNVDSPANSTNYGEWHPLIPQAGYYKVEAFIAAHTAIPWCTGSRTIAHDTTDARYSIYHANGTTTRSVSQYPLSNQWLDLGEYYFNAGQSGYIHLADLNGVSLEEWSNRILQTIPVGRFGKPEDIAGLVAFLASEDAAFINGQSINIDGGLVFY